MLEWLRDPGLVSPDTWAKLVASALLLLALWLAARVGRALVRRRMTDGRERYRWSKAVSYTTVSVGLLVLAWTWFPGLRGFATVLGLLSAGLAIALKDVIANLAGWGFILWRRPFEVGDRVQIGGQTGDVIDLRLFQFTLLEIGNWVAADQPTGRMIHIPNAMVLVSPLANYTKGFQYIWDEIPVLVTFESDWREAKALLERIGAQHGSQLTTEVERQLREASRQFLIPAPRTDPVVYTSVQDSGVLLTLRYVCSPAGRRATAAAVWEDILIEFAGRPTIDFAYPTTRFYDGAREGKGGVATGDARDAR